MPKVLVGHRLAASAFVSGFPLAGVGVRPALVARPLHRMPLGIWVSRLSLRMWGSSRCRSQCAPFGFVGSSSWGVCSRVSSGLRVPTGGYGPTMLPKVPFVITPLAQSTAALGPKAGEDTGWHALLCQAPLGASGVCLLSLCRIGIALMTVSLLASAPQVPPAWRR